MHIIKQNELPKSLRAIPDAPQQLYMRGTLPDGPYIAVVGTRRPSAYGKEVTGRLCRELARAGCVIVSGLAPGIDTISHKAALEARGATVAVLGTGADDASIYPRGNVCLAKDIVEQGGALLSEYEPGTHGSRFTFPKRNRIISGISLGVVVIEGKEKSGTLITARHAREQGRTVFAVPGPITSPTSEGPHALLATGALIMRSAKDVLNHFDIQPATQPAQPALDDTAARIVHVLSAGNCTIDEIIERTDLPAATVAAELNMLEMHGVVQNLGGTIYAKLVE